MIVGARVAGSTLACLLGAAGWRTLVVDRARFPSPTLSTHFFRGAGCAGVLGRLGVLDEVLACGSPPLVREYNADALTGSHTIDPPQDPGDVGLCLSVRRETLDEILVRRARRESTVDVLEGTALGGLLVADGRVTGVEIADDAGAQRVRARLVVGAGGRRALPSWLGQRSRKITVDRGRCISATPPRWLDPKATRMDPSSPSATTNLPMSFRAMDRRLASPCR